MTSNLKVLLGLIGVTLIGCVVVAVAAFESKRLTGEWFGYPLPDWVAIALAVGTLVAVFGSIAVLAVLLLSLADRSGIHRTLESQVLPDDHPAAQAGKSILRAERMWGSIWALCLLAAGVVGAFHDMLTAAILATTVIVIGGIWFLWHRRSR